MDQFLISAAFGGKQCNVEALPSSQIMAMTTMKDHERLDLLKEIGGTKVYEERREESLKVMQETEGRRKRIEEVVGLHSYE